MQSFLPSVLVVDDSAAFRNALADALGHAYDLRFARSVQEALRKLSPPPEAILLDLRLSTDDADASDSLEFLQRVRRELPHVAVIMITAWGDVETAVECMRLGASDFIEKSGDLREIRARIDRALAIAKAANRLSELECDLAFAAQRTLVGTSDVLSRVKEIVQAVARDARITVLITGETGTGKELIARAIHSSGPRAAHAFVGVSIAALPESVVEGELFGYEPGAFTDARRRHTGVIERAHKGVLFLDEIGELSHQAQVKLLRVLEERAVTRLGGTRSINVDLQLVAATNADLPSLVREGKFRQDLYYRLKVCEIRAPALRERIDDIPLMVAHFLRIIGASRGITAIAPRALAALQQYPWPGNVRELRNVVEASILNATLRRRRVVSEEDLPDEVRSKAPDAAPVSPASPNLVLDEALARTELTCVEGALKQTRGKKSEAWRVLGLNDRYAFVRRVRRLCERYPDMLADFPETRRAFCRAGHTTDVNDPTGDPNSASR